MEVKVDQIETKLDKMDEKLDRLDQRLTDHLLEPAESWKKMKWLVISTLVVAIIGLILTLIGINK